jgi:calcium channel MID1
MLLPKLTQLQSRFAASFAASACLVFLYLSLSSPRFAYAVEIDFRIPPDHNHPIIFETAFDDDDDLAEHSQQENTQLVVRQASTRELANNAPQNMNIDPGTNQTWVVTKSTVEGPFGEQGGGLPGETTVEEFEIHSELKKRQGSRKVYITINTCMQPTSPDLKRDTDAVIPPQLQMYLSTSADNQNPGPGTTQGQKVIDVTGGYGIATVDTDDDVYIGIAAPNTTTFDGQWNYAIAASIDAPFHSYDGNSPNLFFVDGDYHAALLITNDTTETAANSTVYKDWMKLNPPPYGMFAHSESDKSILGVKYSYCGLMNAANIVANLQNVQNQNVAGMTNRGIGGKPKEQFYVTALNKSSTYYGFLAIQGNSTASGENVVGGGGKVWAAMNFTTKAENNCALMYNLSFCSEVAYAVPSNPNLFSPTTGLPQLAALYDKNAADLYQNFSYSLQQIACNTTSSAQYSLARNCDDCARAYKQWLCAVTIPRCEDYNNDAPWLKARNVAQPFANGTMVNPDTLFDQPLLNAVATNSSRNPIIDSRIKPGPYKEVLPCDDLCYDLVQSCPASLGFGCPYPGRGLEESYGSRSNTSALIKCSYLGAAYYLSGAGGGARMGWSVLVLSISAVLAVLLS